MRFAFKCLELKLKHKQEFLFKWAFFPVILLRTTETKNCYRAFHRFGQAKFAYGGPVLGSSQFLQLPQLPQKMKLASKVVKIDSKIIISSHKSKSVTHSILSKNKLPYQAKLVQIDDIECARDCDLLTLVSSPCFEHKPIFYTASPPQKKKMLFTLKMVRIDPEKKYLG